MIPLAILRTPPAGKGRPPVVRTVLRGPAGELVLVRRVYSLSENLGNTGSPRMDAWVGIWRMDFAPAIVLGRPGAWVLAEPGDPGPIYATEVIEAIQKSGYRLTDLWPGNPAPDWPTLPWDRRVVLPGDDRWPRKSRTLEESIRALLRERNECPDEDVWAIDALVIALAPRDRA